MNPTAGVVNSQRRGLSGLVLTHPIRALTATALVAIGAAVGIVAVVNSSWQPSGNWGHPRSGAASGVGWASRPPAASRTAASSVDLGSIWGRAFQERATAHEPLAAAKAQANATPAGASVNRATNTLAFAGATVSVTIVANPPNGRDMAFRIAGLENPTLVVRQGARVTVRFVNGDSDSAHGWLLLDPMVKTANTVHGPRAFPDAYAPILGDPTTAGQPLETVTFTATTPGTYIYECPVPGHAGMGMRGSFNVTA
jgi:plastocyanin